MYYGLSLYDKGTITGRIPPGQEEAWHNAGKKPYSVFVNGEYYGYDRLDPFAMTLGAFADVGLLWDIYEYNQNVDERYAIEMGTAVALTLSEPVLNKTWMTGVSDLLTLLTNPERMNLKKFGLRQAEKLIPGHTGIEWWNSNFRNTNIVELNEWRDVYMKKIDPASLHHKRHSIYGTKIEKTPSEWLILKKGEPSDPIAAEMLNIGLNMEAPRAELKGREMTPDQYDEFSEIIAALPVKDVLGRIIGNPSYQAIKDDTKKAEMLRRVVLRFRRAAKAIMIGRSKQTQEQIKDDAVSDAENIFKSTATNNARDALYHQLKIYKEIE
jgi:hypothetical protein